MGSKDYVIRVVDDPQTVDASAWNELLEAQPAATPFMRHEYLVALHRSGSAMADTGWMPQWLLVER
ncbi:MAG: peptidogalycan biosysnthesis protein, partial [Aquincola sp.]|nr:peptidogalycan biosysnthesis protein [Aquincola sp.]